MMLSLRLSAVALAASAALIGSRNSEVPRQQGFNVAGVWHLNREKTERPKETQIRDPESVGTTTMRTGQARGRPSAGSGGNATGETGAGARGGQAMIGGAVGLLLRAAMQPTDSLLIAQDDLSVNIDPGNGYLTALQLDGTAIEAPQADGTIHKTKATLKKDQLLIERDLTTAGHIREIYRFDKNNPNQLIVEFKYENKRQRRTFEQKRVYDRAP